MLVEISATDEMHCINDIGLNKNLQRNKILLQTLILRKKFTNILNNIGNYEFENVQYFRTSLIHCYKRTVRNPVYRNYHNLWQNLPASMQSSIKL